MEDDFQEYDQVVEQHYNDDEHFDDVREEQQEAAANDAVDPFQHAGEQYGDEENQVNDSMVQALEKQMNADAVAHALGNMEEHHSQMLDNRGSMSNLLAGPAKELEYNMTVDKVSHAFEHRPTEEQLESSGIQRTKRGSMSDLLAGTAIELEKHMTIDKVSHAMETRPSEAHLEEIGIIRGKSSSNLLANALAGTAVQLEKEMKADAISQSIQKRASDLGHSPMGSRRSSLSNILAAPAKELEKQIIVDHVSSGLSKRSSKQELLDRGVLKRPPSESHLLAASAVSLEKALTTDRVSERIARTIRAYVDVTSMDKANSPGASDLPAGVSIRERMDAYLKAVREANPSPKSPQMGSGLKERMRAYQEATKSSPSNRSPAEPINEEPVESKMMDSPPPSLKDRMSLYQDAVNTKMSPKNPVLGGINLKDRLAAYQETATSPMSKKQVDIAEVLETEATEDIAEYDDAIATPPVFEQQQDETIEVDKDDEFN